MKKTISNVMLWISAIGLLLQGISEAMQEAVATATFELPHWFAAAVSLVGVVGVALRRIGLLDWFEALGGGDR